MRPQPFGHLAGPLEHQLESLGRSEAREEIELELQFAQIRVPVACRNFQNPPTPRLEVSERRTHKVDCSNWRRQKEAGLGARSAFRFVRYRFKA